MLSWDTYKSIGVFQKDVLPQGDREALAYTMRNAGTFESALGAPMSTLISPWVFLSVMGAFLTNNFGCGRCFSSDWVYEVGSVVTGRYGVFPRPYRNNNESISRQQGLERHSI